MIWRKIKKNTVRQFLLSAKIACGLVAPVNIGSQKIDQQRFSVMLFDPGRFSCTLWPEYKIALG
jgi:hypothetical protein